MNDKLNWNEWILQKNAESKVEELKKSDSVVLEKAAKPKASPAPVPLHESHAPLIAHHLERITGHKVDVHDPNKASGKFHGLHVGFPQGHTDDHTDHIHHALSHLGISHGGAQQHDDMGDEEAHEHWIHPAK